MERPKMGLQESQRGAWLSIVAYVVLTSVKLLVGWWSGSKALTADGVNNLTDVISSVAVLFGLRLALRPADEDHRYGHQKAETVAAMIVSAIMGLIGLDVAFSAALAVFRTDLEVPHLASAGVSLVSAGVMAGVYMYNLALARRTGSRALAAAAYDNRSDALTSLGAVAGIVGAHLGWRWADPVAGLLVALIIIKTAWTIGYEAAHALTDGFEAAGLNRIKERARSVTGVKRIIDLSARHMGSTIAVDITIGVRPNLSVVEAHEISDRLERSLLGFMEIERVHVHVEPVVK